MIGQYLIDLVEKRVICRGIWDRPPSGSAHLRRMSKRFSRCCRNRSARSLCAKLRRVPCNSLSSIVMTLRCRRWSSIWIFWRSAYRRFAKILRVDDEDITDMIGEIRRLDRKPGLKFRAARTQTMCPMSMCGLGTWEAAHRTQQRHPAARAGQSGLLHRAVENDEGRRQILFHHCLQNATWLVRALNQRARTILQVATRSCASRTASSRMAWHICGRATSRRSRMRSRCTSRPCRG